MDIDDGEVLAKLRIGRVRDENFLRKELGNQGFDGRSIVSWAPTALLAELGTFGRAPDQRFEMLVMPGAGEHVALLTLQANKAQARFVMPLGDPGIQRYLLDCMQRGRIHALLMDEASCIPVFMNVPVGFHAPGLVLRLLQESPSRPCDAQTLIWLGRLLRPLHSVCSLILGQEVTHAVTVLVCSEDLAAALH
ncbi:hypothetical protein [Rhizobacter sp. SG703]|uniref:hypothetical protein n=1 Tax=Rhizobacter sp. SG703 TaxID=2587140 RepID=UPI0014486532|nr:hypothetical protein [Rhizobacter sp. SG703]NKI93902.1 hypothetical protein [Rhizobacter sp. SG703]